VKVWLVVVATAGTFWLGAVHGLGTSEVVFGAVLLVALVKAWLATDYLMELKTASPVLRWLVITWLLLTAGVALGLYVGAG
jgi:hypothetical protein